MNLNRLASIAYLLLNALALAPSLSRAEESQPLALLGATIYASPGAAPMTGAVILTSRRTISRIGRRSEVRVPPDALVIDCSGKTIVAGFWNNHVHFTGPEWRDAASAPAASLEAHMQEMLTRWGFTTVWDLGSDPRNSLPLRARVESGEVRGPQILLAGSIFPKGGHPIYLPAERRLPEAATADEAAQIARGGLKLGLDGVKLFTGAYMGDKPVVNMDMAVAKAAVEFAHGQGKPVFAHPQNKVGVDIVIQAHIDVLAHTVPREPDYTADELRSFKTQGTALIPTLSLWTAVVSDPGISEKLVRSGVKQLATFSANGGQVLFGTDAGFTNLYDTTLEFELMHRALSANQVLASLTTNPASYFKAAAKGRLEEGMDADIVVLDGDPIADVRNLAKVAYTIRAGKVIFQRP